MERGGGRGILGSFWFPLYSGRPSPWHRRVVAKGLDLYSRHSCSVPGHGNNTRNLPTAGTVEPKFIQNGVYSSNELDRNESMKDRH